MKKHTKRPHINLSSATVVKRKAVVAQAVVAKTKTFDTRSFNPRRGKQSFFFGAEFDIPTTPHHEKELQTRDLATACCDFAVQCDLDNTYWFVVYKNESKRTKKETLSLRPQHPSKGYVSKFGIIIMRKSDTNGETNAEINRMLEREVFEYGQWLNRPLV